MITTSLHSKQVQNPVFRSDVQGLRAIAVLGVILFHANSSWLPGGFVGVDVFFVISGFLIAGIILQKKNMGQFSFADFYLARGRRIAPAYFAMLAIVTFCAAILLIPKDFEIYLQSAKSAIYFGSNSYFLSFGDYFSPSSHELPLLHTWSLAIEMQFYLLLPALLVFLPEKLLKPTISIAILVFCIFGIVLVANGDKKVAYFSLGVRVPEFLIGVLLALFAQRRAFGKRFKGHIFFKDVIAVLGLLLVLSSFIYINESMDFPGVLIAFPCVGAVFVIAGHGGIITHILSSAPLVWIGSLSYSLYLWHWPVFAFSRYINERYEIVPLVLIAIVFLVFFLSYLSHKWIESPFRQTNFYLNKGSGFFFLSLCALVITSSWINAAVDKPIPIEYSRYADPATICHGQVVDKCLRGSKEGSGSPVLVLGDSHAAQLNLFFDRLSYHTGKQYRVISASSCVTIPGFDVDRIPGWARKNCSDQIDFAESFIPESQEVIIAAMWQYQLQSVNFVHALESFLYESQKNEKKVTIFWQIPMLSLNVQRAMRLSDLGFTRTIQVENTWESANKQISEIAKKYSNVQFLEFSGEELFASPPFFDGILVYYDNHHLNEIGSVLYSERVFKRF